MCFGKFLEGAATINTPQEEYACNMNSGVKAKWKPRWDAVIEADEGTLGILAKH